MLRFNPLQSLDSAPFAWLRGVAVNQRVELPGTANVVTNYSNGGLCVYPETNDVVHAYNGGHGVGLDNSVTALVIEQNVPAWVTRIAASGSTTADADWGPDGRPQARHKYWNDIWVPEVGKIMFFSVPFRATSGGTGHSVHGLNPATWAEDTQGTWADVTPNSAITVACRNASTGHVIGGGGGNETGGSIWRWDQPAGTWSQPSTSAGVSGPMTWDEELGVFFFICIGNGTGGGDGLIHHCKVSGDGTTVTALTFAAGDGTYAAFKAEGEGTPKFSECGMVYDRVNGVHLFCEGGYNGNAANRGKIWRITGNSGTTWDMDVLPTTGYTPAAAQGLEAFEYVENIGGSSICGVIGHPKHTEPVFFVRTS